MKTAFLLTLSIICALLFPKKASAQYINADSLYISAQTHAYAQQYDSAISSLRILLANYPERYDAHLLLCSVYGWQENYDLARTAYQVLLHQYPTVEVYQGGVRVEMWDQSWESALTLVDEGLIRYASDTTLLLLKTQILTELGRTEEAIALLENELPSTPQTDSVLAAIRPLTKKHAIRVGYYHAFFDQLFTPWQIGSIEYQRRTDLGPIIGRVNVARMYEQMGRQVEIDAYPKLATRTYAYLNFGVSDHTIFPKIRWGGEIFQGTKPGIELSAGIRALYFDPTTVYIYTAQVGHHSSSHWISGRVFLAHLHSNSLQVSQNVSGSFTYRKYLKSSDHYFSLYADYGNTPLQVVSLPELLRLTTRRAAADYVHPFIQRTLLVRLLVEYQYETYDELRETSRWGIGVRLEKRF